jgi:hypothetical protein
VERLRNTTANAQTVRQMLELLETTPPHRYMPRLRKYAREQLDAGYPNDQLYSDLRHLYRLVSERGDEELEDAIADVMDFLTGWCAPDARLY